MEIIRSKKFQATLLAVLVAGISTWFDLDAAQTMAVISPILTYILGQGLADFGKEAGK